MSEYAPTFVVIPYRIFYMEGINLSYLKVYEIFFQFWNHGKVCFLSNPKIMERTKLGESTIREALAFFEKHGEMRRVTKGRKRYLLPPTAAVELKDEPVDNSPPSSSNDVQPAATSAGTRCYLGGLPAARSAHNNNNINTNNFKKSFCPSDEQKKAKAVENSKKHSWAEKPKSPLANVSTQSTSWKPEDKNKQINRSPEAVKAAMMALPRHMRPKKYRDEANEFPSTTEIQPTIPHRNEPGVQGATIDVGGVQSDAPPIREAHRVLETRSACSYLEEAGLANSERGLNFAMGG